MKKSSSLILAASFAFATGAALAAPANLVVTNTSGLYSAVKAPIGCSTTFNPNAYTGPGQTTSTTSWSQVRVMCLNNSPCTANLYLGDTSAKTCASPASAPIQLDLNSGNVTFNGSQSTVLDGHTVTGGVGTLTIS